MIDAMREAYVRSWRFARALPWLVAVVVAAEFAQHVVEMQLGMYNSVAQARAMQDAPARMIAGHVKIVAATLLGYCVARYLGHGDDARAAVRLEAQAVRLYVPVLLFGAIWVVIGLDSPPLLRGLGVDAAVAGRVTIAAGLVGFVFQLLLHPWSIAAALGNGAIGFSGSIRLSAPRVVWILAFTLLAVLPMMALHYALFFAAIGRPPLLAWSMAIVDAGVVGFLGVLIVAVSFIVARRITDSAGVTLLPAGKTALPIGRDGA